MLYYIKLTRHILIDRFFQSASVRHPLELKSQFKLCEYMFKHVWIWIKPEALGSIWNQALNSRTRIDQIWFSSLTLRIQTLPPQWSQHVPGPVACRCGLLRRGQAPTRFVSFFFSLLSPLHMQRLQHGKGRGGRGGGRRRRRRGEGGGVFTLRTLLYEGRVCDSLTSPLLR